MAKINDVKLLHKIFGTKPGEGLQPKEALSYGIAGFGQNFICTIISSYLTVFMTEALLFGSEDFKIGALSGSMSVAFLMLGVRVFDALNDPIMGSIVDKTRTKWGKCRPYLKWTAIPIGIVTILCFLPVYKAGSTASFIGVACTYLVWSVVYTICDVPYWGLSTCMTNDTEVRANMLTIVRLLCTLGGGIVTVFVPIITSTVTGKYKLDNGQVDPQYIMENANTLKWTYFICAVVLVVIAMPLFYIGFKNTKERFTASDAPPSLGHNLKLLFKNKELLLVVLSGILGGARSVYTYTGGLYFAKYVLDNEGFYSIMTILVVPGGLVASLLVPWMSKKFTKKWSYIFIHLFGAAVMFVMYFVGYDAPWKLAVCAVGLLLLGLPQGVNNIVTYAMIGDTVDYLEWKTGERGEGICFAMQTFINKIGMAVGAFVGVLAYYVADINPTAADGVYISAAGKTTLWNMLILTGALSMFLTCVPMFFYSITEKKQKKMVEEIAQRKAK